MFFSKLGTIEYNGRLVTDLTRVVRRYNTVDISKITSQESIRDGENIEYFAKRVYGETKWWWVICITNNITKLEDWPMSDAQLEKYIDKKYGTRRRDLAYMKDDTGTIIPYRSPITFIANGVTVDWHEYGEGLGSEQNGYISARGNPVTNEDSEREINDKKRYVRILKREFLDKFVADFDRKIAR